MHILPNSTLSPWFLWKSFRLSSLCILFYLHFLWFFFFSPFDMKYFLSYFNVYDAEILSVTPRVFRVVSDVLLLWIVKKKKYQKMGFSSLLFQKRKDLFWSFWLRLHLVYWIYWLKYILHCKTPTFILLFQVLIFLNIKKNLLTFNLCAWKNRCVKRTFILLMPGLHSFFFLLPLQNICND